MGPWVVCRATLQALSTLFGLFLEGAFSEMRLKTSESGAFVLCAFSSPGSML
jgi:hypothetical protein